MHSLHDFYEYFHSTNDKAIHGLWKYSVYETKLGNREEISFVGSAVVLQSVPPTGQLSLLIAQTTDHRVYRHAAYLMSFACPYFLENHPDGKMRIEVFGQGFQGFIGVVNVDVKAYNAEGVVERIDRFGNSKEHSITRITAVDVTHKLDKEAQ
jgi:hypothetical protein